MLLFAYGSNMDRAQLSQRLGKEVEPLGRAEARGYLFGYFGHSLNWQEKGTANIIKSDDRNETAWGVIYDLTRADFDTLDQYEHVAINRYARKKLKVILSDGREAEAVAYVLKKAGSFEESPNAPLDSYQEKCIEAATKVGIPIEYIEKSLTHHRDN